MRDRRTDWEGREVRRREALARHREDRLVLHDGDEEVDLAVVALRSRGRASALERLARAKREREREGRTAGDDEMENPRGRIGGKRSNTYSGGTFAARNSYMTSLMVLLGRSV